MSDRVADRVKALQADEKGGRGSGNWGHGGLHGTHGGSGEDDVSASAILARRKAAGAPPPKEQLDGSPVQIRQTSARIRKRMQGIEPRGEEFDAPPYRDSEADDLLESIRANARAKAQQAEATLKKKTHYQLVQDVVRLQRMKEYPKKTATEKQAIKLGDERIKGFANRMGISVDKLNDVAADMRQYEDRTLGISKQELDRANSLASQKIQRSQRARKKWRTRLDRLVGAPVEGVIGGVEGAVRGSTRALTQGGISSASAAAGRALDRRKGIADDSEVGRARELLRTQSGRSDLERVIGPLDPKSRSALRDVEAQSRIDSARSKLKRELTQEEFANVAKRDPQKAISLLDPVSRQRLAELNATPAKSESDRVRRIMKARRDVAKGDVQVPIPNMFRMDGQPSTERSSIPGLSESEDRFSKDRIKRRAAQRAKEINTPIKKAEAERLKVERRKQELRGKIQLAVTTTDDTDSIKKTPKPDLQEIGARGFDVSLPDKPRANAAAKRRLWQSLTPKEREFAMQEGLIPKEAQLHFQRQAEKLADNRKKTAKRASSSAPTESTPDVPGFQARAEQAEEDIRRGSQAPIGDFFGDTPAEQRNRVLSHIESDPVRKTALNNIHRTVKNQAQRLKSTPISKLDDFEPFEDSLRSLDSRLEDVVRNTEFGSEARQQAEALRKTVMRPLRVELRRKKAEFEDLGASQADPDQVLASRAAAERAVRAHRAGRGQETSTADELASASEDLNTLERRLGQASEGLTPSEEDIEVSNTRNPGSQRPLPEDRKALAEYHRAKYMEEAEKERSKGRIAAGAGIGGALGALGRAVEVDAGLMGAERQLKKIPFGKRALSKAGRLPFPKRALIVPGIAGALLGGALASKEQEVAEAKADYLRARYAELKENE